MFRELWTFWCFVMLFNMLFHVVPPSCAESLSINTLAALLGWCRQISHNFTVLWRLKFALTSDVSYFMIFMMPHVAILWQIESWFRTVNNWTFLANANRHIFFPSFTSLHSKLGTAMINNHIQSLHPVTGCDCIDGRLMCFLGRIGHSRLPENKDAGNAESQLSDNPLYRLPGLFDNKFRWELLSAKSSLLWVAQVKRNVIYIYIIILYNVYYMYICIL